MKRQNWQLFTISRPPTEIYFSYFSIKTYVVGTQRNRLDDRDGSFEHPKHIMFKLMDKKIMAILRKFFCLTGPMHIGNGQAWQLNLQSRCHMIWLLLFLARIPPPPPQFSPLSVVEHSLSKLVQPRFYSDVVEWLISDPAARVRCPAGS